MKFSITSVIPVTSYGNVQPCIEVEADTYEEALALVQPQVHKLWEQYSPGTLKVSLGSAKRIKAFVGGEIDYDETAHIYTWNGRVYQSGSQYADTFRETFDKQLIAGKMADKAGVSAQDIIDMWELKSEVSRDFGNAIHKALQLYEQHRELATSLEKTTHQHDHPIIKHAVDAFYAAHSAEKALSEVLVVDHKAERAGRIDRLVILGDKHCRVEDYKTNANITKELDVYWKQLEFYGGILKADGWKVEPPRIHHYNGSWSTHDKS